MRRSIIFASIIVMLLGCGEADVGKTGNDKSDPVHMSAIAALASSCSGCHSETGTALADLNELKADQLVGRLSFYKSDPDGTTVMHRLARGYSDEQIRSISAYLAGAGRAQ